MNTIGRGREKNWRREGKKGGSREWKGNVKDERNREGDRKRVRKGAGASRTWRGRGGEGEGVEGLRGCLRE